MRISFVLTLALFARFMTSAAAFTVADVDPFIGTGEAGNCYPGAQAPLGMISWSPNTTFDDYTSVPSRPGYKYDRDEILGFTVTHLSGVGCHVAQDLPILPLRGQPNTNPALDRDAYKSRYTHASEHATPGYYAVRLDDSETDVALTVSTRSGVGEFTFHGDRKRGVLIRPSLSAHEVTAATITLEGPTEVSGSLTSGGFCDPDPRLYSYTLYYFIRFDSPVVASQLWQGSEALLPSAKSATSSALAAYFDFSPSVTKLEMRIGLSYVSVDNARANLLAEVAPHPFTEVRRQVEEDWNQMLSSMDLSGPPEVRRQAATALYHNLLQPSVFSDINGDYLGYDKQRHVVEPGHNKYVNYSNWDTYRTTAQLQGLLYPKAASDMIESLRLDALKGAPAGIPIWGLFNNETYVMNGYSGIPWIVNAWAFGANSVPANELKAVLTECARNKYPRGDAYLQRGFVPILPREWDFSASRTVEYAISDFALSRFCTAVGDAEEAAYFYKRSQGVFKLLDPETGYLRPRHDDGSWLSPFAPQSEDGFNEGNSAHYTWNIPHNVAALINRVGSSQIEARADQFFSKVLVDGWNTTEPYFWVSNEPCFGTPFIYYWLGKPWKTQEILERILNEFHAGPDGLPGDDDVGAMSAYWLWLTAGLYPAIPGEGGFIIAAPQADRIQFRLANGKQLVITARRSGKADRFIQSVSLNGDSRSASWITLRDLFSQADNQLEIVLGPSPSEWATKDVPPSYSE